ncbi:uncharacterized protein METZ01_LOCUS71952, partial [marine metagenome]
VYVSVTASVLVGQSDVANLGHDLVYETYPPPSTIEGNYINQFVRRNDVIIPARSGQARR